jgi:hypothetical protein
LFFSISSISLVYTRVNIYNEREKSPRGDEVILVTLACNDVFSSDEC